MIKSRWMRRSSFCSSACRIHRRWRIGWIAGPRVASCWGRHRQALIKLGKLFEKQRVEKTYRAICVGVPQERAGTIERAILKSGVGSKWKMSLDEAGQSAVTEYRVVRTFRHSGLEPESQASSASMCSLPVIPGQAPDDGGTRVSPTQHTVLSEIEFSPKTGRTHQIRLHAAFALGCPVVGDPFYGAQDGTYSASALPMMLHAEQVVIPLQPSKAPIVVAAPLPGQYDGAVSESEDLGASTAGNPHQCVAAGAAAGEGTDGNAGARVGAEAAGATSGAGAGAGSGTAGDGMLVGVGFMGAGAAASGACAIGAGAIGAGASGAEAIGAGAIGAGASGAEAIGAGAIGAGAGDAAVIFRVRTCFLPCLWVLIWKKRWALRCSTQPLGARFGAQASGWLIVKPSVRAW